MPAVAFEKKEIVIQTAVPVEKALYYTDKMAECLDKYEDDSVYRTRTLSDAQYDEYTSLIRVMRRVWASQFCKRSLQLDDIQRNEDALSRTALFGKRTDFGNSPIRLETEHFRNGFGARVAKEFEESHILDEDEESHYESWFLSLETYRIVVDEALVAYALRPDLEVRCCVDCFTWFTAQIRGRARFCSSSCRKSFAYGDHQVWCPIGKHQVPKAACSGLRRPKENEWQYSGLLAIETEDSIRSRTLGDEEIDERICAPCVAKRFPEWQSYIAPAMQSIEQTRK